MRLWSPGPAGPLRSFWGGKSGRENGKDEMERERKGKDTEGMERERGIEIGEVASLAL